MLSTDFDLLFFFLFAIFCIQTFFSRFFFVSFSLHIFLACAMEHKIRIKKSRHRRDSNIDETKTEEEK